MRAAVAIRRTLSIAKLGDRQGSPLQLQLPGLDLRTVEKVVDHADQTVRGCKRHRHQFGVIGFEGASGCSSCSGPLIAVIGVRRSWLTVATKSFLSCLNSASGVISWWLEAVTMIAPFLSRTGAAVPMNGVSTPSGRFRNTAATTYLPVGARMLGHFSRGRTSRLAFRSTSVLVCRSLSVTDGLSAKRSSAKVSW